MRELVKRKVMDCGKEEWKCEVGLMLGWRDLQEMLKWPRIWGAC